MSLLKSYRSVRDFHQAFSLPVADKPAQLSYDRISQRCEWLVEEVRELKDATSIEDQADALLDIIYLALGAFVELGIEPSKMFDIVHGANMLKRWPDGHSQITENGKIAKPPHWENPLPALRQEVRRQLEL